MRVFSFVTFFCCFFDVGVDPFSYVTIASACMATLKHKFLVPNEIAYFKQNVSSLLKDSIRWLEFLMSTQNIDISHCRNGDDAPINGLWVSGHDLVHNTIYLFFDCRANGCPHCTKHGQALFAAASTKMRLLRDAGYVVVSMWSCEFHDLCAGSRVFREFSESVGRTWNEPLNVRDCFFGGRTNASRLYYKCTGEEWIRYLDYMSLYPYTNKHKEYPIGHPEIITDPDLRMLLRREYFGVVKCRVVPPRNEFHGALPVRHGGKLMFPLCRSCMRTASAKPCEHQSGARAYEGTWCTPELYCAMDRGYEILAVREVHHFESSRVGLFADYVNTFLKSKQEASGWPKVQFLLFCFIRYGRRGRHGR